MSKKSVQSANPWHVRRLLALYRSASPEQLKKGMQWYSEAHSFAKELAERHDITVRSAAGIIAALSPNISWESNVIEARKVCRGHQGAFSCYGSNVEKAKAILYGSDPSEVLGRSDKTGKKVRAFFSCIADPDRSNAVCVDRHAFDAVYDRMTNGHFDSEGAAWRSESANILRRVGMYEVIAQAYQRAAKRLGLRPHQLQAIVWLVWTDKKDSVYQYKGGVAPWEASA